MRKSRLAFPNGFRAGATFLSLLSHTAFVSRRGRWAGAAWGGGACARDPRPRASCRLERTGGAQRGARPSVAARASPGWRRRSLAPKRSPRETERAPCPHPEAQSTSDRRDRCKARGQGGRALRSQRALGAPASALGGLRLPHGPRPRPPQTPAVFAGRLIRPTAGALTTVPAKPGRGHNPSTAEWPSPWEELVSTQARSGQSLREPVEVRL